MPRAILPDPPDQLKLLSAELTGRIAGEIRRHGPIPFSRFMQRALYEPGLGYYSAGLHKLGESGDFVTSPELGGLFAASLARQIGQLAAALEEYDILEVGAGSGRLAADLLGALSPGQLPRRYMILETSADLRRVQQDRLARDLPQLFDRVSWLDRPPETDWQGMLLANEVIDALPVERFRVSAGRVEQMCIAEKNGKPLWSVRPAPPDLEQSVRRLETGLGREFADGYRSEILLSLPAWLSGLVRGFRRGLALFIDYGYPRREYYLPERSDGTLMCHYRHRAHDDVFFWPGLQDITAWVDFTALAEAAEASGLGVCGYASQAMFLLGCGLEQAMAEAAAADPEAWPQLADEARQLTLPGLMGERFQVMGLSRSLGRGLGPDLSEKLSGFSQQDLRYRL